jgi:hypothetical protein
MLTGVVPDHPTAADHFSLIPTWILGGNDQFGTCGPVSVANARLLVTSYLTGTPQRVTTSDVFDLYRRSGNPNFDPATGADDNGVDLQTMLEAVHSGGLAGVECAAFARVDFTSMEELRAAVAIFGSVIYGVNLEVDQQNQTGNGLWDFSQSADWGGHAVMSGRYTESPQDRTGVITWADVVDMTDAFMSHQVEEAWVVIWPEHFGTTEFQQGVNQAQLAADYEALTGQPFPVAPPTPAPGPTPDPGRVPDAIDTAFADTAHAWLNHHALRHTMRTALKTWLQGRGL